MGLNEGQKGQISYLKELVSAKHLIKDFFPTKMNKVLFYQFGQSFSSKKAE